MVHKINATDSASFPNGVDPATSDVSPGDMVSFGNEGNVTKSQWTWALPGPFTENPTQPVVVSGTDRSPELKISTEAARNSFTISVTYDFPDLKTGQSKGSGVIKVGGSGEP